MSNKPKILRPLLNEQLDQLARIGRDGGVVGPDELRHAATESGYSVRHVRRAFDARKTLEAAPRLSVFAVTEAVIVAVFLCCGNIAAAHRLLKRQFEADREKGEEPPFALPSPRTFRRRVTAELGAGQLEYARAGSTGYRDKQVYLKQKPPHRMHTVYMDHTELPIYVVPRGMKHAVKPWITMVMDAATRYPLSWVVTFGRPSVAEVRACLVQGITMRLAPDGETVVGGRPLKAVWDRGLEFLADSINTSCLRLRIMPVALPAYSPHLKGSLERFWRFLKEDLLPPLPGYVEGPRDLRGNTALEGSALGEDDFLCKLAEWMDWFVSEHVNGTTGLTPLQAWAADPTPLDEVPEEQLWLDFLVSKDQRKISKNGIRWEGIDWIGPELNDHVGERVEIRYLPHDRTFIEVFRNNEHLCTAEPNELLSDESSHAVLLRRREARAAARKRFTAANRLRKAQGEHSYEIDKKTGKRNVVVPAQQDLFEDGDDALAQVLGAGKVDSDQTRLF